MMKQIYKQILTILAFVLPLLSGAGGLVVVPANGQGLNSTVITNPLTGIALNGFDPVTYFSEDAPIVGKSQYEVVWSGVPWHFASAANRDVFQRAPTIYAPQFGGHGSMGMARGFLSDADPSIYLVFKARLYLFYSAANREAFRLAPDAAASTGATYWPELLLLLTTK
ncbi:YHS domain-containing (seleno)protein [Devosia rhodophyticola]|uniref:YHS domain-containing (Seleno)protein n=1 Tax=Devosia rhodophyticola TaxID=3026423 RepID=A0ABY7YUR6_9HYPH|nr:YHS domain-containing (seleno)protein [Devosia rhodophyticola]WDR04952.1 YHS domain-containing (seleno)protein [Devosia rhodophyticola]